jgi:cytochrome c556
MIRILCAVAAVTIGATMVMAQNVEVIKERQAIMKKIGEEARLLGNMNKGEAPFDAAKVNAVLTGWEGAAKKYGTLFPDDAKTGEKTRAKAEIWQNKADFQAKLSDFVKAVGEAKAKATTLDGLKAAWPNVVKSCDGCHEKYRGPRVS